MKLLITFISCDTTVYDVQLLEKIALRGVQHEIIDAATNPYSACGSLKEIEAAFEAMHNYTGSDDHVEQPESKIKVLKIEMIPAQL